MKNNIAERLANLLTEFMLENQEKESGATVHLVSSEIDKGKILAQTSVPVLEGDSPEELAARVLKQEHSLYWNTVLNYAKTLGLI